MTKSHLERPRERPSAVPKRSKAAERRVYLAGLQRIDPSEYKSLRLPEPIQEIEKFAQTWLCFLEVRDPQHRMREFVLSDHHGALAWYENLNNTPEAR